MSKLYVTVYDCQQCYGGPEEGGWYYNWLTRVRSFPVSSKEEGRRLIERLREEAEAPVCHAASIPEGDSPFLDTEGYIPTGFSVTSSQELYLEETPGAWETTERPRYE